MASLLERFIAERHPELLPLLAPPPTVPEFLRRYAGTPPPRPYRRRRARHGYDVRARKHAAALEVAFERGMEEERYLPPSW